MIVLLLVALGAIASITTTTGWGTVADIVVASMALGLAAMEWRRPVRPKRSSGKRKVFWKSSM
jgi:hypothetical protein